MDSLLAWFLNADIFIYPCLVVMLLLPFLFVKLQRVERLAAIAIMIYCVTDIVASVLASNKIGNLWFYNLMLFPQFIFVSLVCCIKITGKMLRMILYSGVAFILMLHVINLFWYQGFYKFDSFSYIPAMAWMAACAYFFLREQFNNINIKPFNDFLSWFALATLIDNAGSMPILSVLGWTEYIQTSQAAKLIDVITLLYTLWYLIILTGIIWTRIFPRLASRYQ